MIWDLVVAFLLLSLIIVGRITWWVYILLRKFLRVGKDNRIRRVVQRKLSDWCSLRELSAIRDKAAHYVESSNEFRKCNKMIIEAQKEEKNDLEEEDSQDFMSGDEDW